MARARTAGLVVMAGVFMAAQPVLGSADARRSWNASVAGNTATAAALAAPVTQNMPEALWELASPPGAAYDGIGSWIIPGNVPSAGSGQSQPAYAATHEFDFVNNPGADAAIALSIEGTTRFADFRVYWEDGRVLRAYMPFNWMANRWYFPFVYKAGEGIWAAFVYDLTAAAATYIGSLVVPAEWGGIARESYLYVKWFGSDPAACSGYPHFDVYRMAPTGYAGQVPFPSLWKGNDVVPGTCPGILATPQDNYWSHFLMG